MNGKIVEMAAEYENDDVACYFTTKHSWRGKYVPCNHGWFFVPIVGSFGIDLEHGDFKVANFVKLH